MRLRRQSWKRPVSFRILDTRSSLEYIKWLPKEFNVYNDMKVNFGFDPTYPNVTAATADQYFYASIDNQQPVMISGYRRFRQHIIRNDTQKVRA